MWGFCVETKAVYISLSVVQRKLNIDAWTAFCWDIYRIIVQIQHNKIDKVTITFKFKLDLTIVPVDLPTAVNYLCSPTFFLIIEIQNCRIRVLMIVEQLCCQPVIHVICGARCKSSNTRLITINCQWQCSTDIITFTLANFFLHGSIPSGYLDGILFIARHLRWRYPVPQTSEDVEARGVSDLLKWLWPLVDISSRLMNRWRQINQIYNGKSLL